MQCKDTQWHGRMELIAVLLGVCTLDGDDSNYRVLSMFYPYQIRTALKRAMYGTAHSVCSMKQRVQILHSDWPGPC